MDIKLGKLPAKIDKRTIRLSSIITKELFPELPDSYDIDEAIGGVEDDRIFGNDIYGDCVKAARAHQTLRFEKLEQGIQIPVTDQEVIDDYFKETGGPDIGLYLLNSLKDWRKEGWKIGDRTYTIYAFASVDWKNHEEVKHCIHLLGGVNFGMYVYQADIDQFNSGEYWHLTGNDGRLLGGHGVYAYRYSIADPELIKMMQEGINISPTYRIQLSNENTEILGWDVDGLYCMTWGKRWFMTWDFWDKRVDEAYGIVDNRDDWLGDSPVDVNKLDGYLAEITGEYDEEPSQCPIARAYAGLGNKISQRLGRQSRFKPIIHRYRGAK